MMVQNTDGRKSFKIGLAV